MYAEIQPTQLLDKIQAISNSAKDIVLPGGKITALPSTKIRTEINGTLRQDIEDFHLDKNSSIQLASKLDIPKPYYDRMKQEAPDLWANNCNHWFEKLGKNLLMRTWNPTPPMVHQSPATDTWRRPDHHVHGTIRAILSDRYRRIDNLDIFKTVLPILTEQPDMKIVSCHVDQYKLYIKAIFPKIEGEVARGDVVQSGVAITNSETGNGALKIEALVFRLVCLNGLILPDGSLNKRHLGSKIEVDSNVFRAETIEQDDKALMMKIEDVTRTATNEANFTHIINQLKESADRPITMLPREQVKVLAKKASLTEDEHDNILAQLYTASDFSHWGIANAVTAASKAANDYESATNLEYLGGKIISNPQLLAA